MTELQFLTQVIQTPLTDRREDVTLLSGTDLLAALDAGGYSSQEIQMIALGYDWTFSEESNRLVNLTPKMVHSDRRLMEVAGPMDRRNGNGGG